MEYSGSGARIARFWPNNEVGTAVNYVGFTFDCGPPGPDSAVQGLSGLGLAMRPAIAAGTVALCTRATEEFRHSLASPEPALSGGEAIGVEMLGDGFWRCHPRRLGSFDFGHDVPHELLDLLSPLYHSKNIHQRYGMSPIVMDFGYRCGFGGPTICYAFMQAVGIVNDP